MHYFIIVLLVDLSVGVPVVPKLPETEFLKELGQLSTEFKKYKLKNDLKLAEQYATANAERRAQLVKKLEDSLKHEREEEPLFEPGSEEELKDVWHSDDGMDEDDFQRNLFFNTHDTNGNGVLSKAEIKALVYAQVERLYNRVNDTDEEKKELEKAHAYQYMLDSFDKNKDGQISLDEFDPHKRRQDFKPYHTLIDQVDLPDFQNLRKNQELKEELKERLRQNPDSQSLEELMHYLEDKEVIQEHQTKSPFQPKHDSEHHSHSSVSAKPPVTVTEASKHDSKSG